MGNQQEFGQRGVHHSLVHHSARLHILLGRLVAWIYVCRNDLSENSII
jgi:hypothetical protein